MKKLLFTLATLAVATLCAKAAEPQRYTLTSPNGDFEFHFHQEPLSCGGQELVYSVDFKGDEIIKESKMGVEIENELIESALGVPNEALNFWCDNLKLVNVEHGSVDESWNPVYGERATIVDRYNSMRLKFLKGNDAGYDPDNAYNRSQVYLFDIDVRAYNEGVAFRYHFPEAVNGLFIHITGERTTYSLPEGTVAYYAKWAQAHYKERELKDWGDDEAERPLTLKLPNDTYVSLLEANMTDYARGKFRLSKQTPSTLELSMYDCADVITPYDTPWRVIMAAETPVDLINHNDIVLNLNPACEIEDTAWIKPGKVFRTDLDMTGAKAGVDFAAARGYQYIHLDARWYGDEMRIASDATKTVEKLNLDMKALCDYAATKGVGVFVYVNQRALYRQLDEILPLYKEWGIKGVKFGFVQVGNQHWTTWLHNAVRKCAEYGIMVDIHDEYRPTGFSRTYPNLMSQEGIAGNEEMPEATHNTMLPYTRMLCGAADYTFCYFSTRVKNTKAHQLALPAIYYSPLQFMHWYDKPIHYRGEKELEFWSAIPTVWDDSRAIDGRIGEYIIQARRSGDEWFVGAITSNDARTVTVDCSKFLEKGKKYEVAIYEDDPSLDTRTNVKITHKKVKSTSKLKFDLLASGGVALHFTVR